MTTTKTIITLLVDAYDQPLSSSSSWLETSLQTCKETLTLNVDIDNNNNNFFANFAKDNNDNNKNNNKERQVSQ